jgi:CDP-glucose 4,6-dehydratase
MAAQPLVLRSYESPRETFDVNVMGTVNVLDIAFKKDFVKAVVVVTTDKVYRNDNSGRAFVETDPLEGKDPYSASKVGTESVVAAWQQIAKVSGGPSVFSVRAGNVIGGGDFAKDRLFPDVARSILGGAPIVIRNPKSTRPWQHVLEPLTGYIKILEFDNHNELLQNYNFGPTEPSLSVLDVVNKINVKSNRSINFEIDLDHSTNESQRLELNVSRATLDLLWNPKYTQEESIDMTVNWWRGILNGENPSKLVLNEIKEYL